MPIPEEGGKCPARIWPFKAHKFQTIETIYNSYGWSCGKRIVILDNCLYCGGRKHD